MLVGINESWVEVNWFILIVVVVSIFYILRKMGVIVCLIFYLVINNGKRLVLYICGS